MMLSYRTRKAIGRFFAGLLALTVTLSLILVCGFVWLNRFIVYTPEGARLDFSLSPNFPQGQTPIAPTPGPSVPIEYYEAPEETLPPDISTELKQLAGYRVELDALKDIPALKEKIQAFPAGTAIMLELKTHRGEFCYSTELGRKAPGIDTAQVDGLISWLQAQGYYTVAQLPAFRDYYYIMDDEDIRVKHGLPKAGGNGSLWLDRSDKIASYWLNPASEGAMGFLLSVIAELKGLGFDEVVFSEFRFPDTDQIRFDGDRMEALNQAADTLVKVCATDTFAVSFIRNAPDLILPQGRSRLYLQNIAAADVATVAGQVVCSDPKAQVVFFVDSGDTRYLEYSTIRPYNQSIPAL